ncbi:putative cytochrome P450 [Podospora didyma]|uniref:Cytochrome P450 n=1 Tax=Podospora didyma TaxID=330526 RepID=A0AAE0P4J8_9PEZI|nr:putative cytochrome P450 [Podospora didyma]
MEAPIQHKAVPRSLLGGFSDLSLAYKVIAITVLAGLLHAVAFKSKTTKRFPVFATLEIPLAGFLRSRGGLGQRIYSAIRRKNGSVFGLTSGHQILVNFSGADRFMSQGHQTINAEPLQYTILTRVFGCPNTLEFEARVEADTKDLTAPVERLFMNDSLVTAALERSRVTERGASFVSLSDRPEDMKRWERSANIRLVSPGVVEANLQSLSRDFGACVAMPLLYGHDFMDRYPRVLDDFWTFDNDMFPLLMVGIPAWAPFKMMRDARAARARLHEQIAGLYKRIEQHQKGEPVDFGADMSDVSHAALVRSSIYTKNNWPHKLRGQCDLAVLWGQNANTQPMLFWVLVYVYSTPGLVDQLREELKFCVTISHTSTHPEITSIDFSILSRQCPRMKACLFETYRLANDPASIRYVEKPIQVKDGEYQHELKPGTWVSVPHAIAQRDPSVYADPDTFVPERFLEVDPESGKLTAKYGRLRPWGVGPASCKGRNFAEKELLSLAAVVLSLWDIDPASGTWQLPAQVPGTGVKKPVEDVRVVISRRVF